MEFTLSEKEVEDTIFNNQLLEGYGVTCVARQVRMGVAGIADILAYDRIRMRWAIVEIKKGEVNHRTMAQALRYKYWFDESRLYRSPSIRRSKPAFCILIGSSLHEDLSFLPYAGDRDNTVMCHDIYGIKANMFTGVAPDNYNSYHSSKAQDMSLIIKRDQAKTN